MTDQGAKVNTRALALDFLLETVEKGGYSHVVMRGMLEKYQYLDKKERAFLTRLCEGTLERMLELDAIINRCSKVPVKKMKPVIRNLLRLSVYQLKYMDQIPDSAVCNEAVKMAQKKGFYSLKGFVNGVLRNIARELPDMKFEDLSIQYSTPKWIVDQWISEYGEEKATQMLPMIDALEELLRKIRPYERINGSADGAFERAMDQVIYGMMRSGVPGAKKGFRKAIEIMKEVEYDRSVPKPGVLIVGEYLLNFHPGANHDIEKYLEQNGFEIIEAKMTDVIRKTYFYQGSQIREYHLKKPLDKKAWFAIVDKVFNMAHDMTDEIALAHPLYEKACRMQDLVKESDPIIHHTFDAGEGVLIPGEILHHAAHGCKAFIILQPFGCLPNHVVGRGISKRLKELYPNVQILPLDYDPDVSFANIENRLQMLIMNTKAAAEEERRQEEQKKTQQKGA